MIQNEQKEYMFFLGPTPHIFRLTSHVIWVYKVHRGQPNIKDLPFTLKHSGLPLH